jgi:hypothetical protein
VCIAELSGVVLEAFGVDTRLNMATLKWMLPAFVMALCLVSYGVALLARLHPIHIG